MRVLLDVDGVIADGELPPDCKIAPGIELLLRTLMYLGHESHLWSARGWHHAWDVSHCCGIGHPQSRCHDKPLGRPIDPTEAEVCVGFEPELQIDDWQEEAVPGWNFLKAPGWYGDQREEQLAKLRDLYDKHVVGAQGGVTRMGRLR